MMATLSDSSGQFEATVFDDQVAEQVVNAAKAGSCALLGVELDRRPGEETPRVTIRSLQPFEALARRSRLQIAVEVEDEAAVRRLAGAVAGEHGGTGVLRLNAKWGKGVADLVLGRDFLLDAELAERLRRLEGVTSATLSVIPLEELRLAQAS
jgi:DNA polymerase-3 subunit alpha